MSTNDGLIAPVEPSDLVSAWKVHQGILEQHGNGGVIVDPKIYAAACGPGANVTAIWSRVCLLHLLAERVGLFPPELPGAVRNVMFNVFAKFPIKQLEPGVVHEGFPLDLVEFMKQVQDELRQCGFKV